MSPAVDLLLFYTFFIVVALGLPFLALCAAPRIARVVEGARRVLRQAGRAMREAVTR